MVRNASAGPVTFAGVQVFEEGVVTDVATLVATDEPEVQFVPWTRYPDGSLNEVHVAGRTTVAANTKKTIVIRNDRSTAVGTSLTLAQLQASGLTVTVGSDNFGSAAFAGADWLSPVYTAVAGPKCLIALFNKPMGSNQLLGAWVWVAFFGPGTKSRVLPTLENGWLDKANPTSHSGQFTVTINGTQVFNEAVALPHHCQAPLVKNRLWWNSDGSADECMFKQDVDYLERVGATTTRSMTLPDSFAGTDKSPLVTGFVPLQQSNFNYPMDGGGEHAGLGLETGWQGDYLYCDGLQTFKSMVWNDYSYGHHPVHHRDQTTRRPFRFADYPWVISNGTATDALAYTENTAQNSFAPIPSASGLVPEYFEMAHQPRGGAWSFRATGMPFFVEQLQFIANTNYIMLGRQRDPTQADGSKGIFNTRALQTRALAWGLRALFDACHFTKDGDALKADYQKSVEANATFYIGQMYRPGSTTVLRNPLGLMPNNFVGVFDTSVGQELALQAFQCDFLASAWGMGLIQKVGGTRAVRDDMRRFYEWIVQATVNRFGALDSTTDVPFSHSSMQFYKPAGWVTPTSVAFPYSEGPGVVVAGPNYQTNTDYESGDGPWFASYRAMHDYFYDNARFPGADNQPASNTILSNTLGVPYSPWGAAFVSLAVAYHLGITKALAGYNRVRGATNDDYFEAVAIRGGEIKYAAIPKYVGAHLEYPGGDTVGYIPPAGQRAIVTLNNSTDVDPDNGVAYPAKWYNGASGGNSLSGMSSGTWNWGVWCPDIKEVRFKGGGHGANIADFSAGVSAITRQWVQSGYPQNVPPTIAWTGMDGLSNVGNHNPANDLRDTTYWDYNYTIPTGQPYAGSVTKISVTPHTYASLGYFPPGTPGVGAKGAIGFSLASKYQEPNDEPISLWLHDLETGLNVRATNAAPFHSNVGEIMVIDDSVNRRMWQLAGNGNTTAYYYKWDDPLPKPRYSATWTFEAGEFSSGYPPLYDWMYTPVEVGGEMWWLLHAGEGSVGGHASFFLAKVVSGAPVMTNIVIPQLNGTSWGGRAMLVIWNPGVSKFYVWEGRGATFMHVLTPSTLNFRTCTWAWTKESFSGPAPADYTSGLTDSAARAQSQYAPGRRGGYIGSNAMLIVDGPGGSGTNTAGSTVAGPGFIWTAPGTVIS